MKPAELVRQAADADVRLLTALAGLTDEQASSPSQLPGWSRGHVITHLARHAEAHVNLLRGETSEQYPGGVEGRAADIETGAGRSAAELVADLAHWSGLLPAVWAAIDDWTAPTKFLIGEGPAWRSPATRWREVEIHHVDLGLAYVPSDWPDLFVATFLPNAVESVASRLPEGTRVSLTTATDTFSVGSGDVVDVEGSGSAALAWIYGREFSPDALLARSAGGSVDLPDLESWI